MVNTTHNNGKSQSQIDLDQAGSDLAIKQATLETAEKIQADKDDRTAETDAEENYIRQLSQENNGRTTTAAGHLKAGRGSSNNSGIEGAGFASKITTSFGLSQPFNINYIPNGYEGSSALGKEFTTTSVNLSAVESQQVQAHIADAQQDMEGIAKQDFTAYVLAPEILDEKLKQEEEAKE